MNSIEYSSKEFSPDLSIEENFANLKLNIVSSEKGAYQSPNITRQTLFFRNKDLGQPLTPQQKFDANVCIKAFKDNNSDSYAEIHFIKVKEKELVCVELLETISPKL